jgi:shikimate O-hydroxycinnamoyltransferase
VVNMNIYPLSPVDYIFTGAGSQPITFAFYYSRQLDPLPMKSSLDKILGLFPLLKCRLVSVEEHTYGFQTSDDGPRFETIDTDVPFSKSHDIKQYINPVFSIEGHPLAGISIHRLPNGTLLAISISHALVDGFSYFHFLSSWARLNRGERILNPWVQRAGLWPEFPCSAKALTPEDIFSRCGIFPDRKRDDLRSRKIHQEQVFLPKDMIRSYLAEAKKKYPGLAISENDVIVAWLWKKYLPLWTNKEKNQETHVTCPFDFRRVLTGFPRNYLGCALCFATTSLDFGKLIKSPVEDLAVLIKRTISRVNDDYILKSMETLENLRKQKGLAVLEHIHLRHPEAGLIVTNLTRLPISDLDFGSGPPEAVLTYADVMRGAAIFQAENGVEIMVSHPNKEI